MEGDHSDVKALDSTAQVVVTGHDARSSIVWRIWECARAIPGRACPVVVLLHGSFGAWTHWARNIPALTASCTVVAVDMPGFGESGPAPEQRMPPHMGQALADAWLELQDKVPALAVPGTRLFVAGFSLGGIYAGWLLRYLIAPDSGSICRPAGLMLFGPGGLGPRPDLVFALESVSQRDQDPSIRLAAHRHNLGVIMFAHAENIDDLAVSIQNKNVAAAHFRGPFVDHPSSLLEALEGVTIPVLGVWGEQDAFDANVRTRAQALAAVVPQLESVVLPDAGHWVIYERAAEVNEYILEWVRIISP